MKKQHGHPQFYKNLKEIAELHSEKNRQYAMPDRPLGNFERVGQFYSSLFNDTIRKNHLEALAVALILEGKQVDGAVQIVSYLKKNTPDSLRDKLKDKATYSVIQMIISDEHGAKRRAK